VVTREARDVETGIGKEVLAVGANPTGAVTGTTNEWGSEPNTISRTGAGANGGANGVAGNPEVTASTAVEVAEAKGSIGNPNKSATGTVDI